MSGPAAASDPGILSVAQPPPVLPPPATGSGDAIFSISWAEGHGWSFGVTTADKQARDDAASKSATSYTYTQVRVDAWVATFLGAMTAIVAAFVSAKDIGSDMALTLLMAYALISLLLSNQMLISGTVLGCYD